MCVNKHHVNEAYVGVKVQIHIFIILALDGGEFHVLTAVCLGDSHQYPLTGRLGGAQQFW